MKMNELMALVDEICNDKGYEDSPAYDLTYAECVEGRSKKDAKELIEKMLDEYQEV